MRAFMCLGYYAYDFYCRSNIRYNPEVTISYSFAETNDVYGSEASGMSDEKMVDKIIDEGTDVLYAGDKKIEKLPANNDCFKVEGLTEAQKNDIKKISFYTIRKTDVASDEEQCVTAVADLELVAPESTTPVLRAGGEYGDTKKKGRVTIYSKYTFTDKTFKGRKCRKLTSTGGKVTKKENSALAIRALSSTYIGAGTYYTNAGTKHTAKKYTATKKHTASKYSTFQSWKTTYDRFYDTEGVGILQTRFNVTYGGTTASSQATVYMSFNLASLN